MMMSLSKLKPRKQSSSNLPVRPPFATLKLFRRKSFDVACYTNRPRLKEIFIESRCSSIRYLMRNHWGADKAATLYTLHRHVPYLVKLQVGSHSPASSMEEDNRSQPRSTKSSPHPTKMTLVTVIREDLYSSSSSSAGKKKKGCSHVKRQNKKKKMTATVSPVIPLLQSSVNRSQKNACFCRLWFTKGHQSVECHVVSLLVELRLLHQR